MRPRPKSLRVLHCIDTLDRGGAETLLLDLSRHAYEHGIELHLMASGGGVLEEEFRACAIHFIRYDRRHAFDLGLARAIKQYVDDNDIQVVHGHQVLSTLHALYALRETSVPVVHSIHGFTEDLKNKVAFRAAVRRTHANIMVSRSMHSMLLEREWISDLPHAHVVYNGIDIRRVIDEAESDTDLREELNIASNDTVIGMVGNFYSVKDQLRICKAMALLAPTHPELHCVFAGRFDDKRLVQECHEVVQRHGLEKRVHFLGARTDIPRVLRTMDVFVFSTVKDTFGLALVEAMLCGVPCMASDIDVMREISRDGEIAELFECGNAADLAYKLEQLLLNPKKRHTLSEKAERAAREQYSIESHIYSLRSVYEELIREASFKELPAVVDTTK